jgi:hypothetical protein
MQGCNNFIQSLLNDENIGQYTFFEDQLPPSLLSSSSSHHRIASLEPQNSFRNLILTPENINTPTFDLFQQDKLQRTLLHHAVISSEPSIVSLLLTKGLITKINGRDRDKRTALHYAVMYYNPEIIRLLLDCEEIKTNCTDYLRKTPLNTAFDPLAFSNKDDFNKFEYIEIIIEMVKKGADLLKKDITGRTPLDMIQANDCGDDLFMTGLIKDLSWFQYLPKLKSPLRILNKLLRYDEKTIQNVVKDNKNNQNRGFPSSSVSPFGGGNGMNNPLRPSFATFIGQYSKDLTLTSSSLLTPNQSLLFHIFEKLLIKQDLSVLYHLVILYVNLELSADEHLTEADELKFFQHKISQMIYEMFRCDSMEFPLNIQKILQPTIQINIHEPLLLLQTRSFGIENGVISYCLQKNMKLLFSIPQIADFIDDLFYSSLRKECLLRYEQEDNNNTTNATTPTTKHKINDSFYEMKILSNNLRSCPVASFALRFVSKIILLILITKIIIDYSKDYGTNFGSMNHRDHWGLSEIWLILFTILEVLYEIGQLIEDKLDISRSLQGNSGSGNTRNRIELLSLILIILWSFLRCKSDNINTARVILSLCAIPQSITLLHYLSIFKPIGELVLILRFILKDILVFAIVYMIFVIGFGLTIFALFHNDALFPTNGLMFLQLFTYTLTQFDFSIFQTNSIVVNTIGTILLIFFLIITAILLINLLIAKLTNTHERVATKAIIEWSYTKSQLVSKFLLIDEMHPFKMIPPPFNLLPVLCFPLDYYYRIFKKSTNISLCGTLTNIEYSLFLGSFFRIYGLLQFYFYHLYMKIKSFSLSYVTVRFWLILFPISLFVIIIRMITVCVLPLIIWEDSIEKIDENGHFYFMNMNGSPADIDNSSASAFTTPTSPIVITSPPPSSTSDKVHKTVVDNGETKKDASLSPSIPAPVNISRMPSTGSEKDDPNDIR